MSSVRDSIRRAADKSDNKPSATDETEYTISFLYRLQKILEPYFRKDPEGAMAHIKKTYGRVRTSGYKREFVSDWLAAHGFSAAEAKEMRKRIDEEAAT